MSKNNLRGLSESELDNEEKKLLDEIQLIDNEKSRRRMLRYEKYTTEVLNNLDLLLSITKHTRSSCSDENLSNCYINESGIPRCNRCVLLKAKHDNFLPTVKSFAIDVYLTFDES